MPLLERPTTADLVAAARAGDRDALRELLEAHHDGITAVCRRYLRDHDVHDAVQETLARAMQQLDDLRDPARFGPWVRAIARNVSHDVLGGTSRTITVPDLLVDAPSDEPAPDLQVVAGEARRHLHARLATLSERDAGALWLRDAQGAPVPEVAAALGVTEGSARVLLSRARRRLRDAYSGLAALLGLWRGAVRERVPVAGVPGWAVALPTAAAVALTLGLVVPDPAPPPATADAPTEASAAPAPAADGSPTGPPARLADPPGPGSPPSGAADGAEPSRTPTLQAGPVSVGGDRPDHEPVASVGSDEPGSHGAEVFAGNLRRAADDPVGAAEGAAEHLADVVGEHLDGIPAEGGR